MAKLGLMLVSWAFLSSSSAFSALWEPRLPTERTIETGVGPISVHSAIQISGQSTQAKGKVLSLTGAGIRVKKVLMFQANVYVIRSYAELPAKTPVTVDAVLASPSRALDLTFLRDLSQSQIRESFAKALELNGVSVADAEIQEFLAFVAQDVKEGERLEMFAERTGEGETLWLEVGQRHAKVKGKHVAESVWKIWFGDTGEDSGLAELKARLGGLKRTS